MRGSGVVALAGIASMVCGAAPALAAGPVVMCGGQEATIVGTDDFDYLSGTDGPDVMAGLGGYDHIIGNGGDDIICGNDGSLSELYGRDGKDVIIIETPGTADGGRGSDTIDATGAPRMTSSVAFSQAIRPLRVHLERGTARGVGHDTLLGVDGVVGSDYDDRITGDAAANSVSSGIGMDVVRGRRGDDVLYGHIAADTLYGGRGKDSLEGGGDDDVVRGGRGADYLFEESFNVDDDWLFGGRGVDELYGGNGVDNGNGGPGRGPGDYCDADIEVQVNCEL